MEIRSWQVNYVNVQLKNPKYIAEPFKVHAKQLTYIKINDFKSKFHY